MDEDGHAEVRMLLLWEGTKEGPAWEDRLEGGGKNRGNLVLAYLGMICRARMSL